uniref:Sec1 family domain-containing protein 2 n=1 Tax=Timema shepardi TaxID=629360 RepID=A0A7R9B091_TIMSH|nr:unnamed protein product [Timema shepardi]
MIDSAWSDPVWTVHTSSLALPPPLFLLSLAHLLFSAHPPLFLLSLAHLLFSAHPPLFLLSLAHLLFSAHPPSLPPLPRTLVALCSSSSLPPLPRTLVVLCSSSSLPPLPRTLVVLCSSSSLPPLPRTLVALCSSSSLPPLPHTLVALCSSSSLPPLPHTLVAVSSSSPSQSLIAATIAQCGTNSQKKAVFITCGPIHTTSRTILRDIIQASSFEYCVLITAAHPSVHQLAKYGARRETSNDMAAFHSLEEDMLQWMGNMNFTVEVFYYPLFVVPATETLFLTPPFSELFPLVDCDLVRVREQYQLLHRGADASHLTSLSSLELSSLPPELQVPAQHLVSCLHSLLAQWDMREDLYSLGHFSGLLAAQLEALPAANNRRKVSTAQLETLPAANNMRKVSTAQLEALPASNNRCKVSTAQLEALPASNRRKVSTAQLETLPAANNRRKVSTAQLKVLPAPNNRCKVSTAQLEVLPAPNNRCKVSTAQLKVLPAPNNRCKVSTAQLEDLPAPNNRCKVSTVQLETLPAANNRRKVSTAQLEVLPAPNNRCKVSTAQLEVLPAPNNRRKVSTAQLKDLLAPNNRCKVSLKLYPPLTTGVSQHLGIYSSLVASLVLTDSSQLTSDSQHLGIYSSPMASLVLTDSSQLTSDSQHLGIYSIPMASLVLTDSSQLTSDSQHLTMIFDRCVGGVLTVGDECQTYLWCRMTQFLTLSSKQYLTSASNACSLILVDRTLDLCSATRHDSDSVLDRILAVLPRLPGHSNDVAVNMSPICSAKTETAITDNLIPPGCLSQPNSEQCLQIFESLVSKRQKDVLLSLHQHLAVTTPSSREERGPKLATRVTPMTLDKQVGAFKNHPDKIAQCAGLLQQTLAVTQTLRSARVAQLEVIVSVEKLLLQNLGTSRDGAAVLAQVTQLIKTRRERNLPLEDLLVVLVHLYSLAGTDITFSSQTEMLVQAAVQAALFQDRETLEGFLSTFAVEQLNTTSALDNYATEAVESNMDEEAVGEVTLHIFNKLKSAAKSRKDLTKYRSLFESRGSSQPAAHTGLLRQLVADLLDPARPELPDLSCKSAGLKELLKTGFSLLLNMPRQQHPLDHPMVVIFVVGGITAQEVRHIQEAVADSGLATKVLVGSTRLITPLDTARALFQGHTA